MAGLVFVDSTGDELSEGSDVLDDNDSFDDDSVDREGTMDTREASIKDNFHINLTECVKKAISFSYCIHGKVVRPSDHFMDADIDFAKDWCEDEDSTSDEGKEGKERKESATPSRCLNDILLNLNKKAYTSIGAFFFDWNSMFDAWEERLGSHGPESIHGRMVKDKLLKAMERTNFMQWPSGCMEDSDFVIQMVSRVLFACREEGVVVELISVLTFCEYSTGAKVGDGQCLRDALLGRRD